MVPAAQSGCSGSPAPPGRLQEGPVSAPLCKEEQVEHYQSPTKCAPGGSQPSTVPLDWHSPENTRIGRSANGALFSSQIRAGSHWAHGTGVKESEDAVVEVLLHVTSPSMWWSVIVWGGLSLEGHIDLHVIANSTVTPIRYQDEILRAIIRPYAGAVDPGLLLVQLNARPNVARVCRRFLDEEGIDSIDRPSLSPDLNPNEHLWDVMY